MTVSDRRVGTNKACWPRARTSHRERRGRRNGGGGPQRTIATGSKVHPAPGGNSKKARAEPEQSCGRGEPGASRGKEGCGRVTSNASRPPARSAPEPETGGVEPLGGCKGRTHGPPGKGRARTGCGLDVPPRAPRAGEPRRAPRPRLTFSSTQFTMMDGYLRLSQRKKAGTPMARRADGQTDGRNLGDEREAPPLPLVRALPPTWSRPPEVTSRSRRRGSREIIGARWARWSPEVAWRGCLACQDLRPDQARRSLLGLLPGAQFLEEAAGEPPGASLLRSPGSPGVESLSSQGSRNTPMGVQYLNSLLLSPFCFVLIFVPRCLPLFLCVLHHRRLSI